MRPGTRNGVAVARDDPAGVAVPVGVMVGLGDRRGETGVGCGGVAFADGVVVELGVELGVIGVVGDGTGVAVTVRVGLGVGEGVGVGVLTGPGTLGGLVRLTGGIGKVASTGTGALALASGSTEPGAGATPDGGNTTPLGGSRPSRGVTMGVPVAVTGARPGARAVGGTAGLLRPLVARGVAVSAPPADALGDPMAVAVARAPFAPVSTPGDRAMVGLSGMPPPPPLTVAKR